MNGRYRSHSAVFTQAQRDLLREWIQAMINKKSWEEDLDIHVDELCKVGRKKRFWFTLAINLAHQANVILEEMQLPNILGVVVIQLYANEKEKMGFPFQTLEDIKHAFDSFTPPSLYLQPVDWKIFIDAYQGIKGTNVIFIDNKKFWVFPYEKLWIQDYVHHIRSISLVPYRKELEEALNLTR